MSGNGVVWERVRSRLRAFPECLAACGAEVSSRRAGQYLQGRKGRAGARSGALARVGVALDDRRVLRPPQPSPAPPRPQAAAYGRCVQASMAPGGRLRKDLCAQEFQALRSCFAAAVSGRPHPDPPPRPVSGKGPAGLLSFLLCSVWGARWFFRPTGPRDPRRYRTSA